MAKQMWLTLPAAATQLGNNNTKLNGTGSWWTSVSLAQVRGFGVSTAVATAAAGPTTGIEVVHGTSLLPLEWISEQLNADFTIAGTITFNLWAHESATSVNAAINAVIEKIDGATGTITQIVKTARTTELGTSAAAANFTATPTSTACKRGDRLRIRVYADDAAQNMGSSGTVTFTFNTPTAAASGDSWVQFTETLVFATAGTPVGSTYYLTDVAAAINPGGATEKVASKTLGAGAVNSITNTVAGPTAGVQITDSAGGTPLEWYTPPLEATTIGGHCRFNVRALESNAAANAAVRAEVAIVNGDGSGATVWAAANVDTELGTTSGQKPVYPAGDDTAIAAGQRLRFRIYLEDIGTGPLVAGHTVTVIYNGTVDLQTSHVVLPITVVEQTAGTTVERAAAAVAAAAVEAAGVKVSAPITRSAALAATGQVAVTGISVVKASAAVTASAGIASAGQERLSRSVAVTASAGIASAGREQLARLAELAAATNISVSGQVESGTTIVERSAAVSAAAAIATVGRELLSRSAAVSAATLVATTGQKAAHRSAALTAQGAVTAAGEIEGATVRAGQVGATGSVAVSGTVIHVRVGAAALTATGTLTGVPQRALGRAASVAVTPTLAARPQRALTRTAALDTLAAITTTTGNVGQASLTAIGTITFSRFLEPGYLTSTRPGRIAIIYHGQIPVSGLGGIEYPGADEGELAVGTVGGIARTGG